MNARILDNLNALLDLRFDAVTILNGEVVATDAAKAATILQALAIHQKALRQELRGAR